MGYNKDVLLLGLKNIAIFLCLWLTPLVLHATENPLESAYEEFRSGMLDYASSPQAQTLPTSSCVGSKSLPIWGYQRDKLFFQIVMEGVDLECPVDDASTLSFDEANKYWTGAREGKIVVNYAPCKVRVETDPDSDGIVKGGFKCPDGKRKSVETAVLGNAECTTLHNLEFCAKKQANLICSYVPLGITSVIVGCHELKPPPPLLTLEQRLACFMPKACSANETAWKKTKNPLSITGTVVFCIEKATEALFLTKDPDVEFQGENCPASNLFDSVKNNLRNLLLAAVTLSFIFYGFKIVISQQFFTPVFFKYVIAVVLVLYFGLQDGWSDYYPALITAMNDLSRLILISNLESTVQTASGSGSTTESFCYFDPDTYDPGFSSLALWDTIDCRIMHYLGFNWGPSGDREPKLIAVGLAGIFQSGFGIIILLMIIAFAFFFVGLVIFTVQIYVVSLIGIALLVFLSPIFLPMALFNYTKGFFKEWLEEIVSLSLHPVVMIGFVTLIFATFDIFMYGDAGVDPNRCDPETFGCQVLRSNPNLRMMNIQDYDAKAMALSLLVTTLMAYLFFMFMLSLDGFIAELTGDAKTNIGGVIGGGKGARKTMGMGARGLKTTAHAGYGAALLASDAAKAKKKKQRSDVKDARNTAKNTKDTNVPLTDSAQDAAGKDQAAKDAAAGGDQAAKDSAKKT